MNTTHWPVPARCRHVAHVIAVAAVLRSATGCEPDSSQPPTQQAIAQSQQRTDQAVQQAAEADQQVRHERRLRDIDRLRFEVEITDLHAQAALLRGLGITLTLALLAASVWLAIEVRGRRVLTAVLNSVIENQGGDPRPNSEAPPLSSQS